MNLTDLKTGTIILLFLKKMFGKQQKNTKQTAVLLVWLFCHLLCQMQDIMSGERETRVVPGRPRFDFVSEKSQELI